MDKHKQRLLEFLEGIYAKNVAGGETIEVVYWETDAYGPRIAEIGGASADKRSGWAYLQCDQDCLHLIAAAERLLLAYALAEDRPDDGHENEIEIYEDMVRSLTR